MLNAGVGSFESDLRKFDEFKRLKESLMLKPQQKSLYLKLSEKEEQKRNQHRNAFQGGGGVSSLSPAARVSQSPQKHTDPANITARAISLLNSEN